MLIMDHWVPAALSPNCRPSNFSMKTEWLKWATTALRTGYQPRRARCCGPRCGSTAKEAGAFRMEFDVATARYRLPASAKAVKATCVLWCRRRACGRPTAANRAIQHPGPTSAAIPGLWCDSGSGPLCSPLGTGPVTGPRMLSAVAELLGIQVVEVAPGK